MNTFLELLLELTDGDKFTNKELRDEVNTFIIAVNFFKLHEIDWIQNLNIFRGPTQPHPL